RLLRPDRSIDRTEGPNMLCGVGSLNFDEAVEAEGCSEMGNATSEGSRRTRREHDLGVSNLAARRDVS
ncbi:hypothetical protein UZ36_06115, partial [Candidatus Nitromaritima sp. SCGC AAA799-C22]